MQDTNPWRERSQATFIGSVGGSGSEDYLLFHKFQFWQIKFKHLYILSIE